MNDVPALSKYRLSQAKERLRAAQTLFETKSYSDSISRSYYAMFTAARALLSIKQLDSRKHSGILSLFNQHFVKEGVLDNSWGKILAQAKGFREESDYGDYVKFTEEEAQDQLRNAKNLILEIEKILR